MTKLIARRPIQYMGRTYKSGEALPTENPQMVEAWLRASSAAWMGATQADVSAAVQEAARRARVNDMAAEAIRDMGVDVENTAGEFIGASRLAEQLLALFGGTIRTEPEEDEAGQEGKPPAMLTGHLDPAQLERMTKADLLDLADKLGVDVSAAKNNTERAQLIAAAEVLTPANPPENDGGAQ